MLRRNDLGVTGQDRLSLTFMTFVTDSKHHQGALVLIPTPYRAGRLRLTCLGSLENDVGATSSQTGATCAPCKIWQRWRMATLSCCKCVVRES